MVERNNLPGLDQLIVNHAATGDIRHSARKRDTVNETADKLRNKTRRISTMNYVTEWNLLDDENDER